MPKVEFIFDFGSPNAYLCHRVIPQIEARTGVHFDYVPVLLGGIFKATSNESPVTAFAHIRNKPEYDRLEIERFIRRHAIDGFAINPDFPINTLMVMRGAIAAQKLGVFERYVEEVYRYMWRDHRKMDDVAVLMDALHDSGLPANEIAALVQDAEVKQALVDNTSAAVERGVFGSPSFFVDGEIYFGKDRLWEVEEAIERANARQAKEA
ncbi:2-hydroxychromene-2-carboxylate isomerase [Sphingobium sp. CR2-8]|uniref:2-hydroxychromene-2-carboxylate isomerase n=1 Tax=Sphingobium sp. CR2-8 TaxID=1306534 RepID=UPI002DB644A3|nr:2-hydroxychromene-2-carboxylate isomerase [Sphingobium sp. CR2-8]MEC3909224.1 2-hydroxychromene-2-carboxylate isomerase [Sphingobium sp. CR2-8]